MTKKENPARILSTLSNVAYGIAGLVAYVEIEGPYGPLVGLSCLLLMLGSGYYHWTGKAAIWDERGMYAALVSILGFHLLLPWAFTLVAILVLCVRASRIGSYEAIAAIAALLLACLLLKGAYLPAGISLGVFGLAFYFWSKGSVLEGVGHAMWHTLTAIGFLILITG